MERLGELIMHDFVLFEAKAELGRRLDVSPLDLEYVGLLNYPSKEKMYAPLFQILDKKSPLYMRTRAANMFVKWDVITQSIVQVEGYTVPCLE